GLPAIEEMIARGRNINVTLIFSLERYAEVVESYLRGLERLVESGGDPGPVASVASFFVSTADTEADGRLDEAGAPQQLTRTLERDLDEAKRVFERVAEAGVDYDDVVAVLEQEGVQKFAGSFSELLEGVRAKRGELVSA